MHGLIQQDRTVIHTGRCSFCDSTKLFEVINFGDVAIAGAFITENEIVGEKKYPLVLVFCEDCFALQIRDHIDPRILFEKDFYFSSAIKTLRDHFTDYAEDVVSRFIAKPEQSSVLEFGSNDGVLLKPLADQGVKMVIGVDPAKNIIESIDDDRLTLVNDFFNPEVAKSIAGELGRVDIVMGNNVFAHITDINGTTEAVNEVLKDEGVFIFEVHYAGKIIQGLQYDFIYHEHTYYYTLLALENHLKQHGLVIFDLKNIPIHGGSIRYYAAKRGSSHSNKVSRRVDALRQQEKELGLDKVEAYKNFRLKVEEKKDALMSLLATLKDKGKRVVGYGASGRANTIMQYCGIDKRYLSYVIDDAPAKQGMFTPGSHLQIRDSSSLSKEMPDYILLLAWAFFDEITTKNSSYLEGGGRIVVPLPEVRITMYPKEKNLL